jgi:hypothetical protein
MWAALPSAQNSLLQGSLSSSKRNSPAAEVTNKTVICMVLESRDHRLNIELVLQSLFGLLCTAGLIGWDPATPLLPTHLGSFTRALLVSQDRRHLFVTPWSRLFTDKV